MIIHQAAVPKTNRVRCTYDDGLILERAMIYLTPDQWLNLRVLSTLHGIRVSEVIGKLIDAETETLRSV